MANIHINKWPIFIKINGHFSRKYVANFQQKHEWNSDLPHLSAKSTNILIVKLWKVKTTPLVKYNCIGSDQQRYNKDLP